ncbi:dienelactone hydrolase [Gemmatimonas sp.]
MFVGARRLQAQSGGAPLPVLALYPTTAEAAEQAFGPYTMAVAFDAPVTALGQSALPVALISHGNTGSPFTHRDTAMALAHAGFIVLMPEHLGNSRTDASLSGTVALLRVRPQQVVDAFEALHADAVLAAHADATRRVLIGHSIGAYTVLACSGGQPVNTAYDTPAGPSLRFEVASLSGVRGVALLAPAAGWFMPPAQLNAVTAPVLLYRGAMDTVTPSFHSDILRAGLASVASLDEVEVPNAGHFSFQTPFPPRMATPGFAPATDPAGFDRAEFHTRLNDELVAFAQRCCAP